MTMWGIVASLVAIPLCYYFWKKWDRPTRAARAEQERRLEERATREAFLKEEAKAREHERQQALVQLEERKKVDAMAPSKAAMDFALSSLDKSPNGVASISNSTSERPSSERSEEEIALLEQIPETVSVPDIQPDESVHEILEDSGPVPLKVGITLPGEVVPKPTISPHIAEEVKPTITPQPTTEEVEWPEWD